MMDEADTQLGGVGADVHETERRLTGKVQIMMADPALRGKVIWFLMTARIHLLSEDILRPGRAGDMIIPVFDPDDKDREEFLKWTLKPVMQDGIDENGEFFKKLMKLTEGYYAAAYSSLKSELEALLESKGQGASLTEDEIVGLIQDLILPDIGLTRRIQTLYAVLKCSRKQFLSEEFKDLDDKKREEIEGEISRLQAQMIMRKAV
jgi:SpoVK/Ycf46/Vps4 family AAA+-type ATPase